MISSSERQRAFKPKVRSGCRTCKSRRVKCGEERPSCKRCISAGRHCDGYDPIRIARTTSSPSGTIHMTWEQGESVSPPKSSREEELFREFEGRCTGEGRREHVVLSLDEHLLRAATIEPSIWHTVVAMEAMQSDSEFAYEQHGKALQALHRRLASNEPASSRAVPVLAACLGLFMFERRRHNETQAQLHLHAGLRWIAESPNPQDTLALLPADIKMAYELLDVSDALCTSKRPELNKQCMVDLTEGTPAARPLQTLSEVSHLMSQCVAAVWHLRSLHQDILSDPETRYGPYRWEWEERQARIISVLAGWELGMRLLHKRLPQQQEKPQLDIYRMFCLICKMRTTTMHLAEDADITYSQDSQDFQELLDLCRVSMAVSDGSPRGGIQVPSPDFSIDIPMAVEPIISFVASTCSDPFIRDQALVILQQCVQHYGSEDSDHLVTSTESPVTMQGEHLSMQGMIDSPKAQVLYDQIVTGDQHEVLHSCQS